MSHKAKPIIGVIGAGDCSRRAADLAYDVGSRIAKSGTLLVCGGLGGVMEHACRGARESGGTTLGILPGFEASEANPYVDIAIPTGLSHARNILVVRTAMALVAIEGSYGTLSEIAIALRLGRPVIGLHTWDVDPKVIQAETAAGAVEKALQSIT